MPVYHWQAKKTANISNQNKKRIVTAKIANKCYQVVVSTLNLKMNALKLKLQDRKLVI